MDTAIQVLQTIWDVYNECKSAITEIQRHKVIQVVVQDMEQAPVGQRAQGARFLWSASDEVEELRAVITAAGGVEVLVEMMRGDNEREVDTASGALACVIDNNDDGIVRAVKAEVVPLSTRLLNHSNQAIVSGALGVVESLSKDPAVILQIAASGLVQLVVDLLKTSTGETRKCAADAIKEMIEDAECRRQIVKADATMSLQAMVRRGDKEQKDVASAEGVDYHGNDVGSANAASAEFCFSICRAHAGCKAFSWNDYNGGTCWLKSAKAASFSKAGTRSAVVGAADVVNPSKDTIEEGVDYHGNDDTIEEGVDYHGNDVGSAGAANAELCFGLCRQRAGCNAFSWNDFNGGTCWLKSGKGSSSARAGTRSGVVTPATEPVVDPSTPKIEEGVDYHGNDVGSASAANAELCFGLCRQRAGCKAFSWNDYNGGTCWLKSGKGTVTSNPGARSGSGKGTVTSNPGARSGVITPSAPSSGTTIEEGVDYHGNDVGSASAANAEACVDICRQRQGCKAFSWNDFNGGTCWLKSGKGASSSKAGTRSGVVDAIDPNAPAANDDKPTPVPIVTTKPVPKMAITSSPAPTTRSVAPTVLPAPTLMTCPGGRTPMSVEGVAQRFCIQGPLCSGTNAKGACPGPQPGLVYGSYCDIIRTGDYGCKPFAGPSTPTTVTYPPAQRCAPGSSPVSVVGAGTYCVAEPVCSGDRKGRCPSAQPGLDGNATCAVIPSGVYGDGGEDLRRTVTAAGGVWLLVEKMQSQTASEVEAAAGALAPVLEVDDDSAERARAVKAGVIPLSLRLLSHSNEEVVTSAMSIIESLSKDPDFVQQIATSGIVAAIVQHLKMSKGETRKCAADVIKEMIEDEGCRRQIVKADASTFLRAMVRRGDKEQREAASETLERLSELEQQAP
ncbi:hypothetical protein P43SY_000562 [Pythium insidiosum]|uniref:Apple domain-containing protein n=1 Tax=Pythium insidiosum TaxID=114742 RepID=A0AAD5M361_PYTIN|nr:hypothetical protein P43SY_000562 [Pythium insidiosum]